MVRSKPALGQQKLPLRLKLSYAMGNVGMQMLIASMSFFLLIFYTDVALIPPAIASSALLVGKVWDIINDPLFGWLVDRTNSRFGRFRVYLIFGAAPLAVCAAALWMVPSGLSPLAAFIWIAVTYTIFDTLFTLVQLPYAAMSAELAKDYDERTSLMAISSVGALLGYILGSVLMPILVQAAPDLQLGYTIAGGFFGLFAGVSIGIVAWQVKEPRRVDRRHKPLPIFAAILNTLGNRPFVMLITAFGLVRLGLTLLQTSLAYFVVYQLHQGREALPKILLALLVMVGLFIVFWQWVARRWDKNIAYAGGLTISAVAVSATFWLNPGQLNFMFAVMAVVGVGMAAHWVVPWAMLPDVIEHEQAHNGERRAGMYYGVYGLVDKIARTVGIVAVGWILQFYGYVPNVAQTSEALFGIRLVFGPIPALCIFLAIPLLIFYPMNRKAHARLREKIGQVQNTIF